MDDTESMLVQGANVFDVMVTCCSRLVKSQDGQEWSKADRPNALKNNVVLVSGALQEQF